MTIRRKIVPSAAVCGALSAPSSAPKAQGFEAPKIVAGFPAES